MLGVARHRFNAEALLLANYSASGSLGNGPAGPANNIITMAALPTGKYRIVLNGFYQVQVLALTRQVPATFTGSFYVAGPTDTPGRGDLSELIFRSQIGSPSGSALVELSNSPAGQTLTDYTFEFTLPMASYSGDTSTTLYWLVQNINDPDISYTGNYNLSMSLYLT
jgi:hypothetical protein